MKNIKTVFQVFKNIIFIFFIIPYAVFYLIPESFYFHRKHRQTIQDILDCSNCNPPKFCNGHVKTKYAQRVLRSKRIVENDGK